MQQVYSHPRNIGSSPQRGFTQGFPGSPSSLPPTSSGNKSTNVPSLGLPPKSSSIGRLGSLQNTPRRGEESVIPSAPSPLLQKGRGDGYGQGTAPVGIPPIAPSNRNESRGHGFQTPLRAVSGFSFTHEGQSARFGSPAARQPGSARGASHIDKSPLISSRSPGFHYQPQTYCVYVHRNYPQRNVQIYNTLRGFGDALSIEYDTMQTASLLRVVRTGDPGGGQSPWGGSSASPKRLRSGSRFTPGKFFRCMDAGCIDTDNACAGWGSANREANSSMDSFMGSIPRQESRRPRDENPWDSGRSSSPNKSKRSSSAIKKALKTVRSSVTSAVDGITAHARTAVQHLDPVATVTWEGGTQKLPVPMKSSYDFDSVKLGACIPLYVYRGGRYKAVIIVMTRFFTYVFKIKDLRLYLRLTNRDLSVACSGAVLPPSGRAGGKTYTVGPRSGTEKNLSTFTNKGSHKNDKRIDSNFVLCITDSEEGAESALARLITGGAIYAQNEQNAKSQVGAQGAIVFFTLKSVFLSSSVAVPAPAIMSTVANHMRVVLHSTRRYLWRLAKYDADPIGWWRRAAKDRALTVNSRVTETLSKQDLALAPSDLDNEDNRSGSSSECDADAVALEAPEAGGTVNSISAVSGVRSGGHAKTPACEDMEASEADHSALWRYLAVSSVVDSDVIDINALRQIYTVGSNISETGARNQRKMLIKEIELFMKKDQSSIDELCRQHSVSLTRVLAYCGDITGSSASLGEGGLPVNSAAVIRTEINGALVFLRRTAQQLQKATTDRLLHEAIIGNMKRTQDSVHKVLTLAHAMLAVETLVSEKQYTDALNALYEMADFILRNTKANTIPSIVLRKGESSGVESPTTELTAAGGFSLAIKPSIDIYKLVIGEYILRYRIPALVSHIASHVAYECNMWLNHIRTSTTVIGSNRFIDSFLALEGGFNGSGALRAGAMTRSIVSLPQAEHVWFVVDESVAVRSDFKDNFINGAEENFFISPNETHRGLACPWAREQSVLQFAKELHTSSMNKQRNICRKVPYTLLFCERYFGLGQEDKTPHLFGAQYSATRVSFSMTDNEQGSEARHETPAAVQFYNYYADARERQIQNDLTESLHSAAEIEDHFTAFLKLRESGIIGHVSLPEGDVNPDMTSNLLVLLSLGELRLSPTTPALFSPSELKLLHSHLFGLTSLLLRVLGILAVEDCVFWSSRRASSPFIELRNIHDMKRLWGFISGVVAERFYSVTESIFEYVSVEPECDSPAVADAWRVLIEQYFSPNKDKPQQLSAETQEKSAVGKGQNIEVLSKENALTMFCVFKNFFALDALATRVVNLGPTADSRAEGSLKISLPLTARLFAPIIRLMRCFIFSLTSSSPLTPLDCTGLANLIENVVSRAHCIILQQRCSQFNKRLISRTPVSLLSPMRVHTRAEYNLLVRRFFLHTIPWASPDYDAYLRQQSIGGAADELCLSCDARFQFSALVPEFASDVLLFLEEALSLVDLRCGGTGCSPAPRSTTVALHTYLFGAGPAGAVCCTTGNSNCVSKKLLNVLRCVNEVTDSQPVGDYRKGVALTGTAGEGVVGHEIDTIAGSFKSTIFMENKIDVILVDYVSILFTTAVESVKSALSTVVQGAITNPEFLNENVCSILTCKGMSSTRTNSIPAIPVDISHNLFTQCAIALLTPHSLLTVVSLAEQRLALWLTGNLTPPGGACTLLDGGGSNPVGAAADPITFTSLQEAAAVIYMCGDDEAVRGALQQLGRPTVLKSAVAPLAALARFAFTQLRKILCASLEAVLTPLRSLDYWRTEVEKIEINSSLRKSSGTGAYGAEGMFSMSASASGTIKNTATSSCPIPEGKVETNAITQAMTFITNVTVNVLIPTFLALALPQHILMLASDCVGWLFAACHRNVITAFTSYKGKDTSLLQRIAGVYVHALAPASRQWIYKLEDTIRISLCASSAIKMKFADDGNDSGMRTADPLPRIEHTARILHKLADDYEGHIRENQGNITAAWGTFSTLAKKLNSKASMFAEKSCLPAVLIGVSAPLKISLSRPAFTHSPTVSATASPVTSEAVRAIREKSAAALATRLQSESRERSGSKQSPRNIWSRASVLFSGGRHKRQLSEGGKKSTKNNSRSSSVNSMDFSQTSRTLQMEPKN